MCGIIARISHDKSPEKTLKGLRELEYRGYDSYGILFWDENDKKIILDKNIGELKDETFNNLKIIKSNIEIGHTRWATHGGVTAPNAHPHFDEKKQFFVVMNGIVENADEVRKELEEKGICFSSQTDTEIIPQLYSCYHQENKNLNLLELTKKVLDKLEGEFSFILKYENKVLMYKNVNPMIIGKKKEEYFISSDLNLVESNSDKFFILEDNNIVFCELEENKEKIIFELFDSELNKLDIHYRKSKKILDQVEKNTKYFMEKEILEQKEIRKIITDENIDALKYLAKKSKENEIVLLGAGTSFHAALFMHYKLLENNILSRVILASELKNYVKLIKNKLLVVFSQSGETADLIFPLSQLKDENEIFGIVNTRDSTLSRFAKKTFYLNCGKEVAVASTKAFLFQAISSYLLEQAIKEENIEIPKNYEELFETTLDRNYPIIEKIVDDFSNTKNFFFLGRNQDYPLALEGALKLKEISYIHAEGFAGGELKHGSLALIEEKVPVIVIGGSKEILSNAIEVKTRGGVIIGIDSQNEKVYDYYLKIPKELSEIFASVLMQLLSFKMTVKLGYNPDKPRNLAKSVTVK